MRPGEFRDLLGQALAFVRSELGPEALAEVENRGTNLEIIALNGGLAALDRYSTIFSGQGTDDFRIRFSGKLHGIGARIGRRDGNLTAVLVFPDSPAQLGGLQDGDAIMEIDDKPTRPLDVEEAVALIRGPSGSEVVLGVRRAGEEFDVAITRGEVIVPSVEARSLGEGVGYARIFQVSRSTPQEFFEKVTALGELDGLVLDLRGNSGGSMLAAAAVADFFVGEGTIVRVVGRNGAPSDGVRDSAMANEDVAFRFPVAILVDGGTASAAEILSGALEPLSRVTLIGQTTFGKGLVQRVVPIPEKNLLKLTVAEYWLSEDRAINKKGIQPQIELYPVSVERPGGLANVPEGAIPYLRPTDEDDTFPIDVASAVVQRGRATGEREMREQALARIRESLDGLGIRWEDPELPAYLPHALGIEPVELQLVAGEPAGVRIRVTNPNPFAVPNAWLALASPLPFLGGKVVPLGTLGPGEARVGEIRVTTPDGVSLSELPLIVNVASGSRPLESQRLVVNARSEIPNLEIEVLRADAETLELEVRNRGAHPAGQLRILVPSASRSFENLAPGESLRAELPLAGEVDRVVVAVIGSGVQRGIEIPVPALAGERITVSPPGLLLQKQRGFRGSHVRVAASASEGLRQGWIKIDGEKKSYVSWHGTGIGELTASLHEGSGSVQAMVETTSGVSVVDSRFLAEE
jgi:C-terminal peptidase prc